MISNLFNLNDRIVVITGGLGQLGKQFSKTLIGMGAKVCIIDKNVEEDKFEELLEENNAGGNLMSLQIDITDKKSLQEGRGILEEKWGAPHALINNAALDSPPNAPFEENGPFETYPERSWDEVMDVNVKGVFLCCQVFGDAMAKAKRGSIVNICSIYGIISPDQRIYEYKSNQTQKFCKPISYSASKSALVNI